MRRRGLAAALLLFVWGRWRYDLVALLSLLVLVVAGIVPAAAAFDGFAHPAVVTVAAGGWYVRRRWLQ